jgi:lipid A 3-O-deacylase
VLPNPRTPIVFIIALQFLAVVCSGQSKSRPDFNQEVSLTVDNDIFFFSDWYYTAGHAVNYRTLLADDSRLATLFNNKKTPQASHVLLSVESGNKIFNPKRINTEDTRKMDRPYAGWSYASVSLTHLRRAASVLYYELEFGLVGEISGMGRLQEWVHKQVGYYRPKGWETQIRNEAVVNMSYKWLKEFKLISKLGIVSTSEIKAGTGANKIGQSLTLRMIDFNPLSESTFFNSRLAGPQPDNKEIFLFITWGLDYNLSNIFIEGSLFDNRHSPFTVAAERWVIKRSFGLMYSDSRNSFVFDVNHLSREVVNGDPHNYVRLIYALRF